MMRGWVIRQAVFLIPLAAFAAMAGWFWLGLAPDRDPSQIPSVMIGRPAPDFDLPPLAAGSLGLKSGALKGRVTLVNFFASWCVPCRAEHPLLFTLAQDKRIELDGIAYKNKASDTEAYLAELGNPYARIAVDQPGRAAIDFGLTGVPETFLIDRDGVIRFHEAGPLTEDIIEKRLKPLIAELAK
jgi:cytochrome c biogenesis protein CcmG, thiol:disulfide interchange protein DsbE